jgi:hypothetical protein
MVLKIAPGSYRAFHRVGARHRRFWHARATPEMPARRGIAAIAAAQVLRGVLSVGGTLRPGSSQFAVTR